MKTTKSCGFTLVELVVVLVLVAIFVGLILPGSGSHVQVRGRQTAALSNVKQIILACKIYATDHNGEYPTYALNPQTLNPSVAAGRLSPKGGANGAFAELFPDYLTNETIFCEQGSAFTPTNADNLIDNPIQATPVQTLKQGENTFAYCTGLTDTSNSIFPLVADGFANVGSWTYVTSKTQKGGVWEGKKAVYGLCDGSAIIGKITASQMTVMGNPVQATASYFSTSATGTGNQSWLQAGTTTGNNWLNPK